MSNEVVITETEREWLRKAREYAKGKLGCDCQYLAAYDESNIECWRDTYIEAGYEPHEAVDEDLSYA